MGIQLNHISGLTLALLATAVIAPAAIAQDTEPVTIPDAFEDLGATYSGDYFRNRGIIRQGKRIIGLDFPERALEWDANAISAAAEDILLLQVATDPILRVPDLANPYSTSLLTMPGINAPYVGSEFIFEAF